MTLEKRRWPVAVYDKDSKTFQLIDGHRFTLAFFLDAPPREERDALYAAGRLENIPPSVWLACYREAAVVLPN